MLEYIVSGLVGGIIGAIVAIGVEEWRFRHSTKIEIIKRLAPYLEKAFPVCRNLCTDAKYAEEILSRGYSSPELSNVRKKVATSLEAFRCWYARLCADGMIPEFEALDDQLATYALGLFNLSNKCREHGIDYVAQRMSSIVTSSNACRLLLKRRLRA